MGRTTPASKVRYDLPNYIIILKILTFYLVSCWYSYSWLPFTGLLFVAHLLGLCKIDDIALIRVRDITELSVLSVL